MTSRCQGLFPPDPFFKGKALGTRLCTYYDRGVAPSHLCGRHCSNFFRLDACDVSSIQASQHQKMGLRGNNCGRTDFNSNDVNSLSVNTSLLELESTVSIVISFVLMAVILFPLPFCYLCFLTRPPSHGAANRQRKLTVTLFIMTIVSLLLWLPYVVYTFVLRSGLVRFFPLIYFRLRLSFSLLYHTNSLVNPIIYTIRKPEFRRALLILFKRRQRQTAIIPLYAR